VPLLLSAGRAAIAGLLLCAHAWTDRRRTPYRYTDPAPHTIRAMPISEPLKRRKTISDYTPWSIKAKQMLLVLLLMLTMIA